MDILNSYIRSKPHNQNMLDLFKGEWSSKLPKGLELKTEPGLSKLFEDPRIEWAQDALGGFSDKKILELGPLEGGHSYMLEKMGAKEIISIEGNSRSFLKCLCIKEVLELNKVSFQLGDFDPYLDSCNEHFDVVIASGVLYHMLNPIQTLHQISKITDKLFLWTHYFDQDICLTRKELKNKFSKPKKLDYQGKTYYYSKQQYKKALEWMGFCGGPEKTSIWLTRDSLLNALHDFGFNRILINFDQNDHQHGPSIALCALRE